MIARWTCLICCAAGAGLARTPVKLAAVPSLTPDGKELVFTWNGDLWKAPTAGGRATAITRHPGTDQWPRLSPDGREIAFVSNRLGKFHLYVVPITGGEPTRVGFHSEGYTPECWTPDGKGIVCSAWRDWTGILGERHIEVSREERRAEKLLIDVFGDNGRLSPDGRRLLFCRDSVTLYRQGYHGRRASTIWLADLGSGALRQVCDHPGGNRSPLWRPDGEAFYYLSQENAPCHNVWEMDLASGKRKQLTEFDDGNVILPGLSGDGSVMVFRQKFDFFRFDPRGDGEPERIDIWVEEDGLESPVRRRWYSTVWNNNDYGTIDWTKDGKQMVFTAGGDVWAMDTVLREPVRISDPDTLLRETEAIFSPDGNAVYYLRDDGVGANVWRATRRDPKQPWWANRGFDLEALTDDDRTRQNLGLSPDGKTLVWAQDIYDLTLADADAKNPRRIFQAVGDIYYDWAPDSRWLSATLKDSHDNYDTWILSATGAREPYNLSRHPDYDMGATWSPDGTKIAFYGERGVDRELDIHWVHLRQADEDRYQREGKVAQALGQGQPGEPNKDPVRIDFDGLAERIHRVKIADSRDHAILWAPDSKSLAFKGKINGSAGTYKIGFPRPGAPQKLSDKQGRMGTWLSGGIHWLLDGVPARDSNKYTFKVHEETDIAAYRRHAFRLIWRNLRDQFYDEDFNGKDWDAMREKYEDAAANAAHWHGFGRVVSMLEGELNASHTGFRQDYKEWKLWKFGEWEIETAHVGLRFDHGADGGEVPGIRVAGVIPGSPCDRAGYRVLPGEFLVAVDGEAARPGQDVTELFNGRPGRWIQLEISKVTGERRTVRVQPETFKGMRDRVWEAWRDGNERRIEEWSGGEFAYIHVDQMDWDKFHRFEHEIHAIAYGKAGLVLDVRNNRGGFTADRMLQILNRPVHARTIPRGGVVSYPRGYLTYTSWDKPLVVLCNQYTGSNGEIFSHAIQTLKRGELVGVPTQGAVISMPTKKILDLGTLSIPRRGWFVGSTGEDMELNGAVPDHVVELDPRDIPGGRDPQLRKAMDVLTRTVEEWRSRPQPTLRRAAERRREPDAQVSDRE